MTQKRVPSRIEVQREAGSFAVEWKGGGEHRIPLELLRRRCPCAECAELREQQAGEGGLHALTPGEMATSAEVRNVTTVGHYAIKITWGDGHDTGFYTYDHLWQLGEQSGTP
jgi:DUF971 family protein